MKFAHFHISFTLGEGNLRKFEKTEISIKFFDRDEKILIEYFCEFSTGHFIEISRKAVTIRDKQCLLEEKQYLCAIDKTNHRLYIHFCCEVFSRYACHV